MGMYDEVAVLCPRCNEAVFFQSKAGDCTLTVYNMYNVPASIAEDINDEVEYCTNCCTGVRVHTQTMVSMQVEVL